MPRSLVEQGWITKMEAMPTPRELEEMKQRRKSTQEERDRIIKENGPAFQLRYLQLKYDLYMGMARSGPVPGYDILPSWRLAWENTANEAKEEHNRLARIYGSNLVLI